MDAGAECISVLGGRVIDPFSDRDKVCDLYIKNGHFFEVDQKPKQWKPDFEFDARGLLVFPGLIDVSAHVVTNRLVTQKMLTDEIFAFFSSGVTHVCCLPCQGLSFWRHCERCLNG